MFERQHDGSEHAVLELEELFLADLQRVSHLLKGGHPSELRGQALLGLLEPAGQVAHRSGRPVGRSDGIKDGTPDALSCEAIEGDTASFVVTTSSFDQTESAGACEVFPINMAREVDGHLENDVAHQR
jgi:hypothetical protein